MISQSQRRIRNLKLFQSLDQRLLKTFEAQTKFKQRRSLNIRYGETANHDQGNLDEEIDRKNRKMKFHMDREIPLTRQQYFNSKKKRLQACKDFPQMVQKEIEVVGLPIAKDNNIHKAFDRNLSIKSIQGSDKKSVISINLDQNLKDEGFDLAVSKKKEQRQQAFLRIKTLRMSKDYDEQELTLPDQFLDNTQKRVLLPYVKKKTPSRTYPFIILPTSNFKTYWNLLMIVLQIYAAVFIPYKISFIDDSQYPEWDIFDYIIDAIFFADILINFFSSYYDEQNNLVTEHTQIAKTYLKGWFFIDFIASFPFYLFDISTDQSKYKGLVRMTRLPRLYRLLKMTKLARMLRVMKEQQSWLIFQQTMGMSTITERLLIAIILLAISCHIVGCLWFMQASFQDTQDTWLEAYSLNDNYQLYSGALYWSVQTALAVGYGDIPAKSWIERLFSLIWMLLSVYLYSFAVGALTSLLDRKDFQHQSYQQKLNVMKNIKKEHPGVSQVLFEKVRREILTDRQEENDLISSNILNDLPTNLRIELSNIMYNKIINDIPYIKSKPASFTAFLGPLLNRIKIPKNEYVFMAGEPAEEMFFIKCGKVSAVLPQFHNFRFLFVKQGKIMKVFIVILGRFFGETDFFFYHNIRKYTFRTVRDSEFYVLSRKNFKQVFQQEFRDIGLDLLNESSNRKEKMLEAYQEALQFCRENINAQESDSQKNRSHYFVTERVIEQSVDFMRNSSKTLKQLSPMRSYRELSPFNQYDQIVDVAVDTPQFVFLTTAEKIKKLEKELDRKNKQLTELSKSTKLIISQLENAKKRAKKKQARQLFKPEIKSLPKFFFDEDDTEFYSPHHLQQKLEKKFQQILRKKKIF